MRGLVHSSGHRFLLAVFLASCVCVFVSCAERLVLTGHVFDADQKPVGQATVEVNGAKKETDSNGCFYFDDVSGENKLNLSIVKSGQKPYSNDRDVGSYEVAVTLASENDEQPSSATWNREPMGEIVNKKCAGQ